MPYNEALAERVRQALARRKRMVEKKMFGGVGFLLNGNMCCGVWKEFLILRLGKDAADDALLEPHVLPFDITGKAMSGWVMVEPAGMSDVASLKAWIAKAHRFVTKLPAK